MSKIVLLAVLAAWAAVLIPPLLRSRVENRPNSSVTDFRRQLSTLQRAVPTRTMVPMRSMGRPLAPSPLSRPAAPGRPGQLHRRRADARRRRSAHAHRHARPHATASIVRCTCTRSASANWSVAVAPTSSSCSCWSPVSLRSSRQPPRPTRWSTRLRSRSCRCAATATSWCRSARSRAHRDADTNWFNAA